MMAAHESDPFGGQFSQARVVPDAASWPVLQWWRGLPDLVGEPGVKAGGGFFIEAERIEALGLDPRQPLPGFEATTLRLGGKAVAGWGAPELHLALLLTDFCWEDRETGRMRYAPSEYERRRKAAPGSERELRGRTRALVAVRELIGAAEVPLLLSVRGTYSAALNTAIRQARRMAEEATRLRRQAGAPGAVPVEAFWLCLYAGEMETVGHGQQTSRVALPYADVPAEISRAFLVQSLVEEPLRRPGGLFDQWGELYAGVWEAKIVAGIGGEISDGPETGADDEPDEAGRHAMAAADQNDDPVAAARRWFSERVVALSAAPGARDAAPRELHQELDMLLCGYGWAPPKPPLEVKLRLFETLAGWRPDTRHRAPTMEVAALRDLLDQAPEIAGAMIDALYPA